MKRAFYAVLAFAIIPLSAMQPTTGSLSPNLARTGKGKKTAHIGDPIEYIQIVPKKTAKGSTTPKIN
jgi:hypothetical protein